MLLAFGTIVGLGLCLLAVHHFDAALRWIYTHDRAVWESLGSPPGFLWVPSGTSWFFGALSRQHFVTQFFFGSAPCIDRSTELRRHRRAYLLSALGIFVLAVVFAAIEGRRGL